MADAHHAQGIGTLLLEHLVAAALSNGIQRFDAHTLGDNRQMLDVFRHAGFAVSRSLDAGVFDLEFDLSIPADGAVAERERIAETRSVARLLAPKVVAVIGASRTPGTVGNAVLVNICENGFTGIVHPVNPSAASIRGLKCYPSIADVPDHVDLAIIAVPAGAVAGVLAECGEAGVHGAVILSAGFAEVGADGHGSEAALVRLARRYGMRLIGPNCVGIINTAPDVNLDATFAPTKPVRGSVGFVSQSGALGIAVLEAAESLGLGISSFVSLGNKADISGNDLLQYWEDDPATDVALLYLESFGNPTKFNRLARRFSQRKPIVAVKSGRSEAGRRAASSHTAALATDDILTDTLFRQAGIIRVDTLAQMFDVTRVLVHQPLPAGRRVGDRRQQRWPGDPRRRRLFQRRPHRARTVAGDAHGARPTCSARTPASAIRSTARERRRRGVRAGAAPRAGRRRRRRGHRDLHRSDDQRTGCDRRGGAPRRVEHSAQDDAGVLPRPRPPTRDRTRRRSTVAPRPGGAGVPLPGVAGGRPRAHRRAGDVASRPAARSPSPTATTGRGPRGGP